MKTNKAASTLAISSLVLSLLGSGLGVAAQDIPNSVLTVEEMLKIDNAQALEKVKADGEKAGIFKTQKRNGAPVEAPLPQWSVRSIFGSAGDLKADIVMDAVPSYSTAVGTEVGMCRVQAIKESCVSLVASTKKTRKGACPAKVCWTGEELTAELQPAQTAATPAAGFKMSPLPMPPIPIPTGSDKPIMQKRQ